MGSLPSFLSSPDSFLQNFDRAFKSARFKLPIIDFQIKLVNYFAYAIRGLLMARLSSHSN